MPKLSVVVIAYKMRRQALNTIKSLSIRCQKNIAESDYEIILVENESSENIDPESLAALGSNIRYFRRSESGKSPAAAINFGLEQARSPVVGLLIDGARMVTPRTIEYALMAHRSDENALTAIPGYFIGPYEHQFAHENNYDESAEKALMEKIRWEENPYRLFDVCTMSAANPRGTFIPFMECNCFFTSKRNFGLIGGADERFNLIGGGSLNMHMYRLIGILPSCSSYFILPGEGSFHQLHGGCHDIPLGRPAGTARPVQAANRCTMGGKPFPVSHAGAHIAWLDNQSRTAVPGLLKPVR